MSEFLHHLLNAMIDQHGLEKVKQELLQLHEGMAVANAPKSNKTIDRECKRCGGSCPPSLIHYCM